MVRTTGDVQSIAVPDTLTAVLTTRLDQLDETAKQVAQTASVIGREFSLDTLTAVDQSSEDLDSTLTSLQRRGLIRETSRVPRRVFVFKHALTQETAYNSLLLSRRRELHREVADWLEREEPESINDLARHLIEARENARALPYVVVAGDQAAHVYAMREAIGWYRRALDIVEPVGDVGLARQAYGSELNQVWTNLIDNAAFALDGSGNITLRAHAEKGWVVVEIEDDGHGIPPEIQAKVFDAFFTTKPPGQGTGMGLDITYNIVVHKHRGDIQVQSEPGRTVFKVSLPMGA